MVRVLIADDHPIVRTGLKQILADDPDIEVVGEAENGGEV
ncbi:MAG: DNA-binding response regulator, partial [Deltaproteobacteria bacterium]|nr:DNA-binding response regulator [Deltaproteobacteria bacterium]